MQARSIAPLAATCALVPLLVAGALSGLTSTPGLAQGLSQQALLQTTTQTPVAARTSTPTPIPQATATPTLAPTLAAGSLATATPVTSSTPSPSVSGTSLGGTSPSGTTATVSATPLIPSLVATPFAAAVSSTPPSSSVVPAPSPQGLPASAIFVPGGAVSPVSGVSTTDPAAVASSSLGGPFDQVIDATQGGTLALPDRSLQLTVPAGVANTDFVLVSLTEVGPSSASGNLQVGNRVFALNVVDSGGLTVTNFGTPILVTASATATASAPRASGTGTRGIAALDPTSGQFNPIATDAPSGQLVGSLDRLAAPATTGVPDPALNIASTRSSRSASAPQVQQAQQRQPQSAVGGSAAADPARIAAALGLAP